MDLGARAFGGLGRWPKQAQRFVRRGNRSVTWTPEGLGFGNYLYLWMRAHAQQAQGHDHRVLYVPGMESWLAELPSVRERLTVLPRDVRPWDRRDRSWNQRFGVDFTKDQLEGFIREHIFVSSLSTPTDEGHRRVTINVRRGDYYAVPELRDRYAFNLASYMKSALERASARGSIEGILVVSDGVQWCHDNLQGILAAYAADVEYVPSNDSPQRNFQLISTARRLVGTNSTFSYWAGYVSTLLYGSTSHVVMPGFHARHIDGGHAFQLDPSWDIIDDIPGGWDG